MSEITALTPRFSTEVVKDRERIEIDPPAPYWSFLGQDQTHEEKVRALEDMKAEILRHIDGATRSNVGVHWDRTTVCAHCKEPVESGTYGSGEPACCDPAIAEWTASGGVIEE